MDIQTENIELAKQLLNTDDEDTLQQVEQVSENSKDFWDELPDFAKEGILKAKQQPEAGLLMPHEEEMKKHARYL